MSIDVFMTPRCRDELAQRDYLSRPCTSNGMLFASRLEQEASSLKKDIFILLSLYILDGFVRNDTPTGH